jgi:FKBP12-rapamycin complex-associated protein
MPVMISMMKTCPISMLEFYLQQLGLLVVIVKQHIRNFIPELIELIKEHWNESLSIQVTSLTLIESIATALDGEFKFYLPTLLPLVLSFVDADSAAKNEAVQRLLHSIVILGPNLEEYLHLIVPVIVKVFEDNTYPLAIRIQAIKTVGQLCNVINLADQASKFLHPFMRVMASGEQELLDICMNSICQIIVQMGHEFIYFLPSIQKILVQRSFSHEQYSKLKAMLLNGEDLLYEKSQFISEKYVEPASDPQMEVSTKKLPVNQQQLRRAWEASQRSTAEDWQEWIRRFSVELLKESPSHALRACATLAGSFYPLALELFNAAFVSCWGELYDQFQDELVRSLAIALTSTTVPPKIQTILLNLAEFMEHDEKPLPIDIRTLGQYASKCHAYAKALHYKEMEFISEPLTNTIESLITINHQLQHPDSAIGILTSAQQNHNVELKESWYERLQRWEDGLAAYEKKQAEDPSSVDAMLGRMRCLYSLGEWESLSSLSQEKWPILSTEVKRSIAPMAAAASWGLNDWERMEDYIGLMKSDSPDNAFFRAILAIHRDSYPQAAKFIEKTRDLLDTELTALIGESYNRAYNVIVKIQSLAELEEIINYKQLKDQPESQMMIQKTWTARIKGCQRNIEVWQKILKIRALVITPREDMDIWIKFANLCRKGGRLSLAFKTLSGLLIEGKTEFSTIDLNLNAPKVVYACTKYLWASGNKEKAFLQMSNFSNVLSSKLGLQSIMDVEHFESNSDNTLHLPVLQLLARCYLKLGEWRISLSEEINEEIIPEILQCHSAATNCDKNWYKAWHSWALSNFEVVSYYEKREENIPPNIILNNVVPAIKGFFQSIALCKGNSLQDTLRLLTLWFKYGYHQDVNTSIAEGFGRVNIDTWLEVIPQIIARIHTPSPLIRRLIHSLLSDIGKQHPQALVYSLTVASKSQSTVRKKAALSILDKMKLHNAKLVDQALLVSQELIRVAILWHEIWHEGLEEASRLYFGDHDIEGMLSTLEPLHKMMETGPETSREISFNQAFGSDLAEALDWTNKYRKTKSVDDLNQAWELYYQVFRRISRQLPQLTTLELQYVSPKLLAAHDLELAIPGSYKSGDEVVKIESFLPTLSVMSSKQRPRRLNIKGSDGKEYQYLLKGHEDLRQDERVMQLFGLVNTLLESDSETFKRHLSIQRYPVIPLSPNSGLIGWVPYCDTLHSLIREYRESRRILLNIEHRLMLQMAPDYDNISLLQKVEVFEYALENTTGQDLSKVLWLKSKNSEVWLDRRTNYTRSLAVMSMVGYILGLGDRHPSNLMLDRNSGKIIHIDFGDCFEVAMNREKFPEKIPFRLTRMLISAMEVSGIEGNFRITCENVMRVLRGNKESLMAVLEAFVHDPLINWRLMTNASPKQGFFS